MKPLFVYLLIFNALGFVLMLADKRRARRKRYRIPEAILFCVACFGGSVGTLCGVYAAHHKTRHPSFTIGIPVIIAVQTVLAIVLFVIKDL